MKEAMQKWLKRFQTNFDPDTANSICNSLGLDGEKADECLGLCYQLESDKITQAEFTGGLCVLTGKEPNEVMGILRDVKGTRLKTTQDELDKKAVALYIKRHGREAYESGEIGETLERIEQPAEEYDPVFLSRHPELEGKSITVYHDPLVGDDWAVVNNETGEVIEIFSEELRGITQPNEETFDDFVTFTLSKLSVKYNLPPPKWQVIRSEKAYYDWDTKTIEVPQFLKDAWPEAKAPLVSNLRHEFCHYRQDMEGRGNLPEHELETECFKFEAGDDPKKD